MSKFYLCYQRSSPHFFEVSILDYLSPMSLIIPSGFVCLLWSTWWLSEKNKNGIRRYRQSKSNLVFLFLPGLINLAAFYSLALHMYLFLDDWPDIGTEGFSDALIVAFEENINYDVQMAGGLKSMIFGGEGLFLATLSGFGTVWLQSLPFSRLADRVLQNAPSAAGKSQGEGSVLGGLGRIIDGD